jgi:hypothetical protein
MASLDLDLLNAHDEIITGARRILAWEPSEGILELDSRIEAILYQLQRAREAGERAVNSKSDPDEVPGPDMAWVGAFNR